MLDKVVHIVENSAMVTIENDYLICDYIIEDKSIITKIFTHGLISNSSVDSYERGDATKIELILSKIFRIGFFETKKSFLSKNRYSYPSTDIYIYESHKFLKNDAVFIKQYESILKLISVLLHSSKHTYEDGNIKNAIILREEVSLFLPVIYSDEDFIYLQNDVQAKMELFVGLLSSGSFEDKKDAFLNNLVSFLNKEEVEEKRFSFLLRNFVKFYDNSQSSYNYYLRQYSYSKYKLELDSKALEFNQKIQAVINDSQTKLIAIPTALVLVLTTFNYDEINSAKNYLAIIGLIIFCVFIQLFINNQKSAINFISENINHYKSTFKNTDLTEMEASFKKVDLEKRNQIKRLFIIEILLWFIPVFTISVIVFFNSIKLISICIIILYFIMSIIFYLFKTKS